MFRRSGEGRLPLALASLAFLAVAFEHGLPPSSAPRAFLLAFGAYINSASAEPSRPFHPECHPHCLILRFAFVTEG